VLLSESPPPKTAGAKQPQTEKQPVVIEKVASKASQRRRARRRRAKRRVMQQIKKTDKPTMKKGWVGWGSK